MIRSTMMLGAVLAGLAAPAVAQDRTREAEAAAAQAERAAADALRAAQLGDAPLDIQPPYIEPADIEPLDIEPLDVAPSRDEAAHSEPQFPIEWVAWPVVQPLGEPALVVTEDPAQPAPPAPVMARDEVDRSGDGGTHPVPQLAAEVAYPPLEGAVAPAPRPARRVLRRVQLAYSPEQREAWLAQCYAVYRGGYDCAGYLAHYERASGAVARATGVPSRMLP